MKTIHHTSEEQQIIDENAEYVLGMYDLYPNDQEIMSALKAKGINPSLIPYILLRVRTPAYQKRLKQSKNMIRSSSIVIFIWLLTYIGFTSLPGSETVLRRTGDPADILVWTVRVYREFYYVILFFALLFLIAGLRRYKRYSRLLNKYDS